MAVPQTDIGSDPGVVGEFACAVEAMGYRHVATYDHVLGANVASRPDWDGPFTSDDPFHDTFVLFGYLAAVTETIELSTEVLILPQRQTALVAKQAASVDVLSDGRLRLGVGVGWNEVEYTGLGEDFSNRGIRCTEQAEVLKALWTEPHVDFTGEYHQIPDAGINPLPIQQPIPLWFGGNGERFLRRVAQHGDGWVTLYHRPNSEAAVAFDRLRGYAEEVGRAGADIGLGVWVSMGEGSTPTWRDEISRWAELGVSHVTLNTAFDVAHHNRIEGTTLAQHLEAVAHYIDAVGDLFDEPSR